MHASDTLARRYSTPLYHATGRAQLHLRLCPSHDWTVEANTQDYGWLLLRPRMIPRPIAWYAPRTRKMCTAWDSRRELAHIARDHPFPLQQERPKQELLLACGYSAPKSSRLLGQDKNPRPLLSG